MPLHGKAAPSTPRTSHPRASSSSTTPLWIRKESTRTPRLLYYENTVTGETQFELPQAHHQQVGSSGQFVQAMRSTVIQRQGPEEIVVLRDRQDWSRYS